MRTDPTAVLVHTIASLPLRVCLAWVVGTLGAFTPIFIAGGFESFVVIGWQLLFFPFYLFLVAMFSGWWSFVALPLLIALAWRCVRFLHEDGYTMDLFWIFALSYLIGLRGSGDQWPFAVFLAGVAIIQREH